VQLIAQLMSLQRPTLLLLDIFFIHNLSRIYCECKAWGVASQDYSYITPSTQVDIPALSHDIVKLFTFLSHFSSLLDFLDAQLFYMVNSVSFSTSLHSQVSILLILACNLDFFFQYLITSEGIS
jgi:hypothetical protein